MTGFVVYLDNGTRIVEKNNFFDTRLGKICATNWHMVDQGHIARIELWWRGICKVTLEKTPDTSQWIFYHTGSMSPGSDHPTILSRTIGNVKNGIRTIHTVDENTGIVTSA